MSGNTTHAPSRTLYHCASLGTPPGNVRVMVAVSPGLTRSAVKDCAPWVNTTPGGTAVTNDDGAVVATLSTVVSGSLVATVTWFGVPSSNVWLGAGVCGRSAVKSREMAPTPATGAVSASMVPPPIGAPSMTMNP